MSFEGYYQRLCKNGHLSCEDVYMSDNENYWRCSNCKEPLAWWNLVDQTNEPDEGKIELEEKEPATACQCHCGHIHVAVAKTYRIPDNVGHPFKLSNLSLP